MNSTALNPTARPGRWLLTALGTATVLALVPLLMKSMAREPEPAGQKRTELPPERNPLHELTEAEVRPHRGTAGLDPGAKVEAALMWKGGGFPLKDKRWFNGFYFVGPGKILPEAALRVYQREQIGKTRSEKRKGEWTDKYWSGPNDCSALAWLVRDEKGFTLRVNVKDDKFVSTEPKKLWLNDSLEVFFDVRHNDLGKCAYERGVFQLILAPNKDGTVRTLFKGKEVPGTTARCRFVKDGYQVTLFLPIKGLESSHFYPVNSFNFELLINDSDTPGDRDTTMIWSGHEFAFMGARRFGHMRSIRRGYYFTGEGDPPSAALMRMADRFHARIRCQDWKRDTWRPGGGTWESPKDCSAVAWLRKADDELHFHIDVTDDKLITTHSQPWNQDSVELYFDFRAEGQRGRAVKGYDPGTGGGYKEPPGLETPGIVQLFCALKEGGGPIIPDFGRYLHKRKPTTPKTDIPGTRVTSVITNTGYSIDVHIPYKGLKVNHPLPDKHFNFDFVVNDADNPKGRDTAFTWSGWLLNYQNHATLARMEPVPSDDRK